MAGLNCCVRELKKKKKKKIVSQNHTFCVNLCALLCC